MAVVHGTGVAVRLATDEEVQAVASARHGQGFVLTPPRSFVFAEPDAPLTADEVLVVSQAFVEFILSDMRIAGLGVSRRELMSAPRRIELDVSLVDRLAPLQRG